MDKQRLIQYLQNVVDLEKQVYLQKRALYQLDNRIKSLGHEQNIAKKQIRERSNKEIWFEGLKYVGRVAIVYAALALFALPVVSIAPLCSCRGGGIAYLIRQGFDTWVYMIKVTLPYAMIVFCIILLISIIILLLKRIRDSKENASYTKQFAAAKHADAVRVNNELAKKKVLEQEHSILYGRYQKTQETLRRFYDVGVIYGKYRHDFAAVASFLDYFQSGRCSTLGENRGGDGAYNLYESELRQNIIINKLDQVLSKLDQIRDNQYSLACAIQEGNRMSQRLVQATERLAIAGEQTARNSEIAAYNSQQSANELNQIKWLQLYGMTLR